MRQLTLPKGLDTAAEAQFANAFGQAETLLGGMDAVEPEGRLGFFQNRRAKAIRGHIEVCVRLAPEHPATRWLLGWLAHIEGDAPTALEHLKPAAAAAPGVERVLALTARLALSLGEAEVAERCARSWLEADPADLDRMTLYARALLIAGHPKRALGVIANACKANPNHAGARLTAELVRKILNGSVPAPSRLVPI